MTDPVYASDGFTYERESILREMRVNPISTKNQKPLTNVLVPNVDLKLKIES